MIKKYKDEFLEFITRTCSYSNDYNAHHLNGLYVAHLTDGDKLSISYSAKFSSMALLMPKDDFVEAMRSLNDSDEIMSLIVGIIYFKPQLDINIDGVQQLVNAFDIEGKGIRIRYICNLKGDIIDITEFSGIVSDAITDSFF